MPGSRTAYLIFSLIPALGAYAIYLWVFRDIVLINFHNVALSNGVPADIVNWFDFLWTWGVLVFIFALIFVFFVESQREVG